MASVVLQTTFEYQIDNNMAVPDRPSEISYSPDGSTGTVSVSFLFRTVVIRPYSLAVQVTWAGYCLKSGAKGRVRH